MPKLSYFLRLLRSNVSFAIASGKVVKWKVATNPSEGESRGGSSARVGVEYLGHITDYFKLLEKNYPHLA